MAKRASQAAPPAKSAGRSEEPTKEELQRHLKDTRESLSHTVAQLKDTVEAQVESVKETVGGVLDYREQFQKEPLLWSMGTLSAGFALGYTLGYAHKNTRGSKHKSQVAAFADGIVEELSTVGQSLVMPALNSKIRELFGFDFSEVLAEVAGTKKAPKRIGPAKRPAKAKARKAARKKSVQR
ncbi:MAG: hypothetical protein QOD75_3574 [Blastocatellia bacterium]|nr:hypothetical protein [Blastocatellia bacterium]